MAAMLRRTIRAAILRNCRAIHPWTKTEQPARGRLLLGSTGARDDAGSGGLVRLEAAARVGRRRVIRAVDVELALAGPDPGLIAEADITALQAHRRGLQRCLRPHDLRSLGNGARI